MKDFIEVGRPSAPRIPDELWERLKPVLVDSYRIMTLPQVMALMERKHGFIATKRQYVHRFQAWNVKKYKRPRGDTENLTPPRPASPNTPLSSTNALTDPPKLTTASLRVRNLLADMLLVLGDFHGAFSINADLWHGEHSDDYIVACVRTAQTQAQAEIARSMVKANRPPEDDESWSTAVFDFSLAYTYDWRNDAGHGDEQIAKAIPEIVPQDGQGQDCLRELAPREPFLDIPTYVLFQAALIRYNQTHQDGDICIPGVMQQFLEQQPAFRHASETETDPLLHIDCLSLCLRWSIDALSNDPSIPLNISGSGVDPVDEAYLLLCTLWKLWLDFRSSPSPTSHTETAAFPAWADNVKQQLGIAPTELLSTVVCMIVAAVPRQERGAGKSVCQRALAGARALEELDSRCLIQRFLDQVWASNRRLAFRSNKKAKEDHHGHAVSIEVVATARRFVAESLGIHNLPALEPGTGVYPLVLADIEQSLGSD